MSTTVLSMYDFVELRNSNSTSSSPSVTVASCTGEKPKIERLSGLYQQQHHSQQTVSSIAAAAASTSSHKMSGGIRRTVSSAAPTTTGMGTNAVARPVTGVVKSLSSNTQASAVRTPNAQHITGGKDPHKKLDRSFSEPAEKKNAASSAAFAAASLGPSSRYKTELCRSFAEVGSCKYGDKCQFAHGDEELRTVNRHPKFKTENCKSFHSTGFCPYGPRCHFIHNSDESKKSISNHNVPSTPTNGHQRMSFDSQVSTTPSTVTHQHMQSAAVCQPAPAIAQPTSFPATSPAVVMNNANLVRPKALSLGSYSLGSSGEISPPSSQSGSPTSLNSFFAEDGFVGLGAPFSANSVGSRMAPMSSFPANSSNTFSFSPDSAFSSFTSGTISNGSTSGSSLSFGANNGSQKCIFGGSQPTLSSRYSPEPTSADETASSVIYSLFGGSPNSVPFNENSQLNDFIQRAMSPIGKPQLLMYPSSPESPVDSVASEIEALKLGEAAVTSFSPISSSFSTSSLSTSSASPPNGIVDLDAFTLSNCANIPRLPTFAKFATTSINGVNCHD